MENLLKVFKKIQNFINNIIAIVLILIMCVIFLQTFTRYVIFYSLPWSEELSRYLFVIMIALGINIGISKGMMVRIDLVDSFLSPKIKLVFEIGRDILSLLVSFFFLYSSIGLVKIGSFQKSPAMQIPMNIMYTFLFIGFLLTVLSLIIKIMETVKDRKVV